ncbi:MAG: erythromycin biosynthesis sensory transduction protein eryC1 [Actinobacteria bacterium]|nr:erythromycin biosynthesis sensory transduction protein eryC1 [Actinomycetota bacterium]
MQVVSSIPINDLSRWDPTDLAEVTMCMTEVANSGYFMRGPHTSDLEKQLGVLLNEMKVVCVGNGTDALVLSLLSLGIKPGEKVATVANAGGYATGAILRIGAIPVLVDVELVTAQMSVASLSRQLETHPDIRAVIATHLYGLMADMQLIREITSVKGILLVEDCAQAIGASQHGIPAGAWGDASTFSFYPTKNLACLGDGGAVAFKNPKNADTCRRLAQYGWSERYVISNSDGFNSRLDEIQAAILVSRIQLLSQNNQVRRSIVARYVKALNEPRYMVHNDADDFVGHLAVMITPHQQSDIEKLNHAKVGNGIHYPVLDHHQSAWTKYFEAVLLPNSEQLVKSIITLPCFPLMTEDEITRVCDVLESL